MRLPLLVFHITFGVLAMVAGAAAASFSKGSRWHARAGNIFVASMLCMAAAASCLAYMKRQPNNVFSGFLTVYMVATAWATARRRDGETGVADWIGFLFASGIGVLSVFHGFLKMAGGRRLILERIPSCSFSWVRSFCLPRSEICGCCCVEFPANGGLRGISGGCASGGSSPLDLSSWDSNRYFPRGCADRRRSWCPPCCHWRC